MNFLSKALTLGLIVAAGAAAAQQASNPVVQERIAVMQTIRINTGALGDMASGKVAYDEAAATAAKTALAAAAADMVVKFAEPATDPVSKSSPRIWADYEGFTAQAEGLVTAAEAMDVASLDGIKAGMGAVGGTCRVCHQAYRN